MIGQRVINNILGTKPIIPKFDKKSRNNTKGYTVFNATDNVPASGELFSSIQAAKRFIKDFPNRYKKQGFYSSVSHGRINPEHVELVVLDENREEVYNNQFD